MFSVFKDVYVWVSFYIVNFDSEHTNIRLLERYIHVSCDFVHMICYNQWTNKSITFKEEYMMGNNNDQINSKDFLIGSLIGGIIGATAALFLAPKSGRELRQDLNQGAAEVKDRASEWSSMAQEKGIELKNKAYEKGSELKDKAMSSTSDLTKKVSEGTQNLTSQVQDKLDKGSKQAQKKVDESNRKANEALEATKDAVSEAEKAVQKN